MSFNVFLFYHVTCCVVLGIYMNAWYKNLISILVSNNLPTGHCNINQTLILGRYHKMIKSFYTPSSNYLFGSISF